MPDTDNKTNHLLLMIGISSTKAGSPTRKYQVTAPDPNAIIYFSKRKLGNLIDCKFVWEQVATTHNIKL